MESLQTLTIDLLRESKLNPRRHFDQAKLEELAASIKAKGIITPLLVRPMNGHFEIGAGHRRYRAAKLAGLTELPCVVRELDDLAFLEVLTIENLQRDDLTPLEEAEGYQALIKSGGYDVKKIAERVGRSEKYVYDRVKLLGLVPEVAKLLREAKITAGHAILLARLKPADQKRAIKPDERAVFEYEHVLEDPDGKEPLRDPLKTRSVRELDAWIAEHVRFDPAAVDPMLFPETATLVHHTQQAESKIVKITHNHYIQEEARDPKERTFGPMSWKRADGKAGAKPCAFQVIGVIVVGPGRGQAFPVCVNKEKCKVHWQAEKRERARRHARGEVGGRAPAGESPEARAKREAKAALERQVEELTASKITEAVVESIKWPLSADDVAFAAEVMQDFGLSEALSEALAFKKKGKLSPREAAQLLISVAYEQACESDWRRDSRNATEAFLKRHKIDRKKIEAEVRAELTDDADEDDGAGDRKKKPADVKVGQRVAAGIDFSGVPRGTEGVIDELYPGGCMVAWDLPGAPLPSGYSAFDDRPAVVSGILRDGFSVPLELGLLNRV